MCSCRMTLPGGATAAQRAVDHCERCGQSLSSGGILYQCAECGWENDGRTTCFACAEEARPECDWCAEHLCRFYGGLTEPE